MILSSRRKVIRFFGCSTGGLPRRTNFSPSYKAAFLNQSFDNSGASSGSVQVFFDQPFFAEFFFVVFLFFNIGFPH